MAASIWTEAQAGTGSYPTGGFTITTSLSSVDDFVVNVSAFGAALPTFCFDVALNSPGAGQVKVKIMRRGYDKLTGFSDPTGLPSGVSLATASGSTYVADTAHTHGMDHDHAAATSTAPTAGGVGVNTTLGSGNLSTHTHSFDPPAFTGTTGAGSSHTHTWDNIYEHQHTLTNTTTDTAPTELANGTNLSGITFNFLALQL